MGIGARRNMQLPHANEAIWSRERPPRLDILGSRLREVRLYVEFFYSKISHFFEKFLNTCTLYLWIFFTWIVTSSRRPLKAIATTNDIFHGSWKFAHATSCSIVGRLGQFVVS